MKRVGSWISFHNMQGIVPCFILVVLDTLWIRGTFQVPSVNVRGSLQTASFSYLQFAPEDRSGLIDREREPKHIHY